MKGENKNLKEEKIKVFELFSGIGAPLAALKKAGIKYESLGHSEIEKSSIKMYEEIHREYKNYGDITKIDKLPDGIDLLVHGSPCQDFSIAGKRRGGLEGSGTRSSLMWETVRLVKKSKPKVVIWENVLGSLQGEMKDNFVYYLKVMEDMGYKNTYDVLSGLDFNIPQIRRRVFVVSYLTHSEFVDLSWIRKKKLTKRLIDYLEEDVDSKYYLSEEKLKNINIKQGKLNIKNYDQDDKFFLYNGITQTLLARQQTKVLVPIKTREKFKEAYVGDGIYLDRPEQKRGTVQKGIIQTLKTSAKDIGVIDKKYAIRYLTPLEYWLLMGFCKKDYECAINVASKTNLYKAAGNSIIVDVLVGIFEMIYKEKYKDNVQLSLF